MFKKILTLTALAVLAMAGPLYAQQLPVMTQQTQNIKRIPLQKFDVQGTNYETIIGIAEIVPNVNIGRHSHFGSESGYVLEGESVLLIDGPAPSTTPGRAIKARK